MEWTSFLAPIDSYTNLPFRMMCQRYGADACCVPLVSAYTITLESKKISMVDTHQEERNVGVQLVGKDPKAMGEAAKAICRERNVAWLNLNCGCPSAHTMGSGGGSALLDNPGTIRAMIETVKANSPSIPLSVKMRTKGGLEGTKALCRIFEEAGADFIIIHGRTPEQGYSGKTDWVLIKSIHESSGIPIVGNGDIRSASVGRRYVEEGYCDAYMIGRSAMQNPSCFSDKEPEGKEGRFALLDEYMELSEKYLGEVFIKDLKLKAMNFLSGVPGACAIRNTIAKAKTVEEIMALRD